MEQYNLSELNLLTILTCIVAVAMLPVAAVIFIEV